MFRFLKPFLLRIYSYYRPPGGGLLFDIKVIHVISYAFFNLLCLEESKGKMLNVITYKENVLLFKKIIYLNE